jgi:uncharacterized membrane protein HdeD (DUF308 family)
MSTPGYTQPGPPGEPGNGPAGQGQPQASRPGESTPAAQDWSYPAGPGADHAEFEPDFARSAWPAFMAAGVGAIAVGIILLVWPKATLTIAAVLIGAALIVAGLLRLIDGFTAHDDSGGNRVAHVVIGLLAIIIGLYCIRHYHVTITALAVIVGLFWVLHGIADIAVGLFGGSFSGRGLTIVAGVLSVFAGLIVLFWPTITITILVVVIGIWLLVYGLIMAFTALSLRRRGAAAADHASMASA